MKQIFGNIVLHTGQNWFYETSKKPEQFKLNNKDSSTQYRNHVQ